MNRKLLPYGYEEKYHSEKLKDQNAQTIRNGEGLILFMYRVTGKVKTYD